MSGLSGIKDLINHLENRDDKKKILIIDDDPGYISLLRGWLKDDYKVFMSTSGETALEWLSGNSADLILLDFEMPDINGPQMLRKIREQKGSDTPVVYITGNELSEVEASIRPDDSFSKPDGCILKTIGRDEMLRLISSYLKS
ncbi:MAG: response regulator [Butyrivibrio sp.]|nr:response regulator [Butyrivibrio sp.]